MNHKSSVSARGGTGLVALVVLLAGCAGSDANSVGQTQSSPAAASRSVTGTAERTTQSENRSAAPVGDVIPDGLYERMDPPDGIPATFKFVGDRYSHFVLENGAMVLGDLGTTSYDTEGNWVAVSESTGCPGCKGVIDWTVKGDVLTLRLIETDARSDGAEDRAVIDGEWRRVR